MSILNKNISQKNIIQALSILVGIVSLIFEILSLDHINSLPYFLMGICLSIGGVIFAKKILLFSPVYNFLNCVFFAYVFSGLYYFCCTEDVMGTPALIENPIFININFIYITFFLSIFIPILLYLIYYKKQKIKLRFFEIKLHSGSYDIKICIFNIILFMLILISLKYTGMNLKDAFLNSANFRHLMSNGTVAMIYIIILTTFSYIYTLVLKDIITKSHKISFINKFIMIFLFLIWAFICGSKSVLIFTGIFPFIFIYAIYKPIKLIHLYLTTLGIILVLSYSAFLNVFRTSGFVMLNSGDFEALNHISIFATLANRNDNFANSIKFFKHVSNEYSLVYYDDFHYKEQIKNHFIKFLPKTIRNNITNSDCDMFGTEMSKIIYPEAVEFQKATFEFGLISNLYYCFGFAGVIVGGILLSLFTIFLEILFNSYIYSDIFLTLYLSIIYNLQTSLIAVGIINVAPTMKLFYTIPVFLILVGIFMINTKIKIQYKSEV